MVLRSRAQRAPLKKGKNKKNKIIYIYLSGFDKRYLQKFQVRFNNLTLEVNKKQLKVAS